MNARNLRCQVRASLDQPRDQFTVDIIDNGASLPVENRHSVLGRI